MDEQEASIGKIDQNEQNFEDDQSNVLDSYNCIIQLQKDLEFIQLLSNPDYIIQLHMRGYLYDDKFLRYLEGLKYINSEKYITLIKYPEGLLNLERIKSKGFAQYLKKPENVIKFKKYCLDRHKLILKKSH